MSGLTRGLQLIADFFKLFFKAIRSGKAEAVTDCISVGEQWLAETVNASGVVKINPIALAFGSDPWKDSRAKYREVALKWNGKL